MIKEINVFEVEQVVKKLCIDANKTLSKELENTIYNAYNQENNELAKKILSDIGENIKAAQKLNIPICQDTGMAVIFIEIGQDVHFVGGSLFEAINKGVAAGYLEGLLRKSVVADPLNRVNTGDNTPAIIHTKIVDGSSLKITVVPKGFGSENKSEIHMLSPSDGRDGVVKSILDTVKKAGNNACPPMVIGVGIGGDFETCALLSKQALYREVGSSNENPFYRELEEELMQKIQELDIGPQGFGGKTTALAVNIEYSPTHIAGLPVAVNIGCHVTRHKTEILG